MRFSVLGPIEVETADGERRTIGSANQRAILAMLLSRPGTVVATDELIDGLWGDDPPPSALKSLRTYVSRLRKVVGDRLVGHDDGYSLGCTGDELDARTFEEDVGSGRYAEALRLWRGRPYGDAADLPVVRGDAVRLESLISTARSGHLEELLARGRLADAVSGAEAVVVDDPLNEAAWATLVRALASSGRVADALRAFQRASSELAEAGLGPGSALRSAEAEALADPDPPAVPMHRRHVPPKPLTGTVGVGADIDRLVELTGTRRLVTIVGPGGVGKTRVSLEVGRSAAGRHELGTRVVELSRISEPNAIGPAIRRALDLSEDDSGLLDGLGAVDALLVLDNCEHLVDAVAAEVPALLAGGDQLHVLATSREPLGIAGEVRWTLAPLSTRGPDPPALQLFIERARDAGVELDAADDRARTVVAQLDGLPLALEMAAARLATRGLADLADELERTVASLRAGRGAAERHSTLRAVLAWSEALLTPGERSVLADFSMFAGPVDADDVAAAVEAPDPVGSVCALAERSLVTVDTTAARARYRSLETVRQFGRERLVAEGRFDAVARRHAEWFTNAAEEAASAYDSADQAAAVARIDDMFDELRAAHLWARLHDPTLAVRLSHALFQPAFQGLRVEVFDWSLALAETVPEAPGAAVLAAEISYGLTLVGQIDAARHWAERAIDRAEDPRPVRAAYGALADIGLYTGDLAGSIVAANRYDRLVEEAGTRIERAMAKASRSLPLAYLGRHSEALAVIPAEAPVGAPPTARAWLAYSRGEVMPDTEAEAALHELDIAVALAESVDSRFLAGVAQVSAASRRARCGRAEQAIGPLARTVERFAAGGNTSQLLTTLRNLPTLLARLGEWTGAAEILGGLSTASTNPTYGDEAVGLAAAERAARQALGDAEHSRSHRRGAERSLDQTAAYAVALLDGLGSDRAV